MISKTLAGSGIKRDLATVSDEKRETPMETPKMVERPSGFDELNRKLRRLRVVKTKRLLISSSECIFNFFVYSIMATTDALVYDMSSRGGSRDPSIYRQGVFRR